MAHFSCPGCDTQLQRKARFCSNCGYQFEERSKDVARKSVLAIAVIFGGVLLTLVLSHSLLNWEEFSDSRYFFNSLFQTFGFLACGVLALPLLGRGATAESLAGPSSTRNLGLGLVIGLLGYGVSILYVTLLARLQSTGSGGDETFTPFVPSLAVMFITSVIFPAFSEEWTDRGALWVALRRIVGPKTTIFCTALMFAFMHGLNGGGLFEVPHRFVAGLGLGWIRMRSGSLWPGIAGHVLWNILAMFLE